MPRCELLGTSSELTGIPDGRELIQNNFRGNPKLPSTVSLFQTYG